MAHRVGRRSIHRRHIRHVRVRILVIHARHRGIVHRHLLHIGGLVYRRLGDRHRHSRVPLVVYVGTVVNLVTSLRAK